MSLGFILALLSVILVLVTAGFSYYDKTFFPSQMTERYPIGLPLIANGALWGGLLFLSPTAYLIGNYAGEWRLPDIVDAALLGVVVSALMHYLYSQRQFPDALVVGGKPLPKAGLVHLFYLASVAALLVLFYCSNRPTQLDVLLVGLLLLLHAMVANHLPLIAIQDRRHFPWYPQTNQSEETSLQTLGISAIIIVILTIIKL